VCTYFPLDGAWSAQRTRSARQDRLVRSIVRTAAADWPAPILQSSPASAFNHHSRVCTSSEEKARPQQHLRIVAEGLRPAPRLAHAAALTADSDPQPFRPYSVDPLVPLSSACPCNARNSGHRHHIAESRCASKLRLAERTKPAGSTPSTRAVEQRHRRRPAVLPIPRSPAAWSTCRSRWDERCEYSPGADS